MTEAKLLVCLGAPLGSLRASSGLHVNSASPLPLYQVPFPLTFVAPGCLNSSAEGWPFQNGASQISLKVIM